MSDLISRKALLEALRESHKHHASNSREKVLLMRDSAIVNEQPTAYDPNKIVEQLEEQKETHEKLGSEASKLCVFERFEARPRVFDEKMCHEKAVEALDHAIEIVKKGGNV